MQNFLSPHHRVGAAELLAATGESSFPNPQINDTAGGEGQEELKVLRSCSSQQTLKEEGGLQETLHKPGTQVFSLWIPGLRKMPPPELGFVGEGVTGVWVSRASGWALVGDGVEEQKLGCHRSLFNSLLWGNIVFCFCYRYSW